MCTLATLIMQTVEKYPADSYSMTEYEMRLSSRRRSPDPFSRRIGIGKLPKLDAKLLNDLGLLRTRLKQYSKENKKSITQEKLQNLSSNGSLVAPEGRSRRRAAEHGNKGYQSLPPPTSQKEETRSRNVSSAPHEKKSDLPRTLPKINSLVKGKYEVKYGRTLRNTQEAQQSTNTGTIQVNNTTTQPVSHPPKFGTSWASQRAKDHSTTTKSPSKQDYTTTVKDDNYTKPKIVPVPSRDVNSVSPDKHLDKKHVSKSKTITQVETKSVSPSKVEANTVSPGKHLDKKPTSQIHDENKSSSPSKADGTTKNVSSAKDSTNAAGATKTKEQERPKLETTNKTSFATNNGNKLNVQSNKNSAKTEEKISPHTPRTNTFHFKPSPRTNGKSVSNFSNKTFKNDVNNNVNDSPRSKTYHDLPSNRRARTRTSLESRVSSYDTLSTAGDNPYSSEINQILNKLKKKAADKNGAKKKTVSEKDKNVPPWHRKEYILTKNEAKSYMSMHSVYGRGNKNFRMERQTSFFEKLEQMQMEDAKRHNEELRKKQKQKEETKIRQQKQLKRARQRFEDERTKRFKTQWVTSKVLEYEKMNRHQYGLPENLNDDTQYESKLKRRKSSLRPKFKQTAARVRNMKKYSDIFREAAGPRWDPNAKTPKMDGIDTVELENVGGSGKTKKIHVSQILHEAKAALEVPSKDSLDTDTLKSRPTSQAASKTDLSNLDLDSLDLDDDGDADEDEDIFEKARKKYNLDLDDDSDDDE